MVNTAVHESCCDYVCVLWSDMQIPRRLFTADGLMRRRMKTAFCTLPRMVNQWGEAIPSLRAPAFHNKRLKILSLPPAHDGSSGLYPFDYCGVFNRREYEFLGGYDPLMRNIYWQKVDFGFRAHLWGFRCLLENSFRITCLDSPPSEDETPDEDYKRFFLKNLIGQYNGDYAWVPRIRFFAYWPGIGSGLWQAIKEFREISRWIEQNRYLFQDDAKGVTELWEVQE